MAALSVRAQRAEDALAARAAAVLAEALLASGKGRVTLNGATLLREPEAILLRVVAAAIVAVAGARTRPVRLDRFEGHVLGTIRSALSERARCTLNLGGALIEIGPDRRIRFSPEPPRRTGRS